MNTQNTLELARQGNTEAITTLMNKALQPKGITVQVNNVDENMTIIAESTETPDQAFLVNYVRQSIEKLNIPTVKRIYIRGQKVGSASPVWRQTINLQTNQISSDKQNSISELKSKSNKIDIFNILVQFREITNTVILGGILGILAFNLWWERQPKVVEWEYEIQSIDDIGFSTTINKIGGEGWELVFARRALSGEGDSSRGIYECIFKRPKQKDNDGS